LVFHRARILVFQSGRGKVDPSLFKICQEAFSKHRGGGILPPSPKKSNHEYTLIGTNTPKLKNGNRI
jgi:hypothetical protein